jgi:hypothetical protein
MHHPIQPLATDDRGTIRFKANKIVQYLLDNGGITMNDLAMIDFDKNDRQQFAQLIGYSLGGYSELSYVDNEAYGTAEKMFEDGLSEDKARISYLEDELFVLRSNLRKPIARLFGVHPDDLNQ